MVPTGGRNIFVLVMLCSIMVDLDNPVKRQARKAVETKPEYRQAELKYLKYIMQDLSQEALIECLQTLNIRELKMAIGAGVPGHAMYEANKLLSEKKHRMEMFIESDGAVATVETELNEPVEVSEDAEKEFQPSEEG